MAACRPRPLIDHGQISRAALLSAMEEVQLYQKGRPCRGTQYRHSERRTKLTSSSSVGRPTLRRDEAQTTDERVLKGCHQVSGVDLPRGRLRHMAAGLLVIEGDELRQFRALNSHQIFRVPAVLTKHHRPRYPSTRQRLT